jgi:enoyl-CoA hydratase
VVLTGRDGGALVLPFIMGLARAREMLFLGERVSSAEALQLGMVNRVVPADKLLDEAMDLEARLTMPCSRSCFPS